MIELERTFLLKSIPPGLHECPSRNMIDIYFPKSALHPVMRLRKDGDRLELTKKEPLDPSDKSEQREQTIELTKEEFDALASLDGKRLEKTRYMYEHSGKTAEIDVFGGGLRGLVIADFEFSSRVEMESFEMPEFCLAEVTHEEFLAGGMLCGKGYPDIEAQLATFGYAKPL